MFIYVKLCFCWHVHFFVHAFVYVDIYIYIDICVCMYVRERGSHEVHQQHVTQKLDTFLPVLTRNFNFYF